MNPLENQEQEQMVSDAMPEGQSDAATSEEQKPSKREAFLALNRNRPKITDFTGHAIVDVRYSAEEGVGLILKSLREDYFHLDEEFLHLAEGRQSFVVTRLYAPVYCSSAVANYYWKKGSKQNLEEFTSSVNIDATVSAAPAFLKAEEWGAQEVCPTGMIVSEDNMLALKKPSLKDGMKLLKEKADVSKPIKKADCILTKENYQLVYVPIIKVELTYGDKIYTQWVNLVNGAVKVEYAVANEVLSATDKTLEKLSARKRSIFSCLLYALTFVVLSILQGQIGDKSESLKGGLESWLLSLILGGVAFGVLLLWLACFSYKKNKFINRAVLENKMPSAKITVFWNLLAGLLAIASVTLFAVFALM